MLPWVISDCSRHCASKFPAQELINSQNRLCRQIPGFQYYLGYVGGAYRTSTVEEENAADKLLVDYASHFAWFPHTYNHTKTHLLNTTQLLMAMRQSKAFAKVWAC